MELTSLPLPAEPATLKTATRTLLEQAPEVGLATLANGEWIAAPLWIEWRHMLSSRGYDWTAFVRVVAGYQNELRLWVMGERPWDQAITGLAGRVLRRAERPHPGRVSPGNWGVTLARVGVDQATDLGTLDSVIQKLGLEYTISAPTVGDGNGRPAAGAYAVVWSGGKRRDPEVPYGEATSATSPEAALAEALARFLVKDPGYPVP